MIKQLFQIFIPKDKIFFQLFERVAENSHFIAGRLFELVYEPDIQKRANILNFMEDIEHKNDDITHEIFIELGKNFITPIDREDIHLLATTLDDVTDLIYSCGKRIVKHKINPFDTGIQKFAELIKLGTEQTHKAIISLKELKRNQIINDAIIKINSLENQGDDIYDMSIEQMFTNENDFKELIKKREIYQNLELVTDKLEDVFNVIESILIKYA